jgi:predicted O-methyltransferase YrrM
MNFTEDWFSHNIPNFEMCMQSTHEKKLFLEIGAFEGRATCWLLENGLSDKGSIVCIDPFTGSVEHGGIDMPAVEARFWSNTNEAKKAEQKVSLMRTTSYKALAELIELKYAFDFVYVDGSHAPDVALTDACMAWGLLKQGGVMLFDDYLYPHEPTKVGIDAFLTGFEGKYDLLFSNYQLAVKKK